MTAMHALTSRRANIIVFFAAAAVPEFSAEKEMIAYVRAPRVEQVK